MHDVTNQAKKHRERFAKEKTDLLRWYEMSGVKDGNTKIRLQQHIHSDSYRHVVSFCCSKYGKNTKKNGKKNLFQRSFREFHEGVERKISFTNNSIKKEEKVGRYGKMEGYFKTWL